MVGHNAAHAQAPDASNMFYRLMTGLVFLNYIVQRGTNGINVVFANFDYMDIVGAFTQVKRRPSDETKKDSYFFWLGIRADNETRMKEFVNVALDWKARHQIDQLTMADLGEIYAGVWTQRCEQEFGIPVGTSNFPGRMNFRGNPRL